MCLTKFCSYYNLVIELNCNFFSIKIDYKFECTLYNNLITPHDLHAFLFLIDMALAMIGQCIRAAVKYFRPSEISP